MGWNNPPISWSEYERRLSGRRRAADDEVREDHPSGQAAGDMDGEAGRLGRTAGDTDGRARPPGWAAGDTGGEARFSREAAGDGGAGPGPRAVDGASDDWREHPWPPGGDRREWVEDPLAADPEYPASRSRPPYQPIRRPARVASTVPYAELHCHSNFSFLDGASHPEELAEEAARLGLAGLALTDHDGLYGVVRFAEVAKALGVPTVFGAELSLGLAGPQNGVPDPEGQHLLVLARDPEGYASLSRAISEGQLAGTEKGRPVYQLERLAELAAGHWRVLTGCRKGTVPAALAGGGPQAAARELDRLVSLFGADQVAVELIHHDQPYDDDRNTALAELATRCGVPTLATNNVHYATPQRHRLASVLAAVRARRSLDEADGWLPPAATAHLRTGEEMAARFTDFPDAVARTAEVAAECAFDLQLVAPNLPDYPVPAGQTEMTWLRELTYRGARDRYRGSEHETAAYVQIAHELDVIDKLGFPGYFLIVYDIVKFCRDHRILCQGRGSAANSAVCYALGITNVEPVGHKLLFERFLAPERDGPPDIDLDIESDRREEVIQDVYRRYGRHNAAQVANVISYRPRSAVRDVARAFGYSPGQQDAWSKQIDRGGYVPGPDGGAPGEAAATARVDPDEIPEQVIAYANALQTFPRHLGIHSGGMVLCDRPVIEVCPVEWARMPGRTVLQWDKDDCAATRLVKFDLLGLGMLSALHDVMDLIRDYHGDETDLAKLPQEDPAVYDMLCEADSVGVFQVESRAQMATLPRLRPREFYDLVVEVALIRPGPIQGGSVHPYIRRRKGEEPVTFLHDSMKKSLARTLGVPLFQEQLMQMAIDVAGFDAAEADQLRRAMGSKRSEERMAELKDRLYAGMAVNGVTGAEADDIFLKLSSFANFGFPESHAYSFAYLVYASSWYKLYYPAAFCASLLNAQPMGFYSPNTLVADARRHGVQVRRPDVNASTAKARLEPVDPGRGTPAARGMGRRYPGRDGQQRRPGDCGDASPPTVRLGLSSVRLISDPVAERIEAERTERGPYADMADVARRVGLSAAQMEALATADAFGCFGLTRREALWGAGAAAQERSDRLPGTSAVSRTPVLPGMAGVERAAADVWATGLSPDSHPVQFARVRLDSAGAVPISRLDQVRPGSRVLVGGVVTHRQRPGTAGGVTFLNLEDETGMLNVVCSAGAWKRHRRVARTSPGLLIRGKLERAEGVTNLIAERIERLDLSVRSTSRDFR